MCVPAHTANQAGVSCREDLPEVSATKMSSEFHDQEQLEYQLGELMARTEHLATPRIFECESCGSRVIMRDESEPCPQCAVTS